MPGFDRTGPQGMGPMTGGRRGMCGGGSTQAVYGAGYGYGRGRRQGGGFRFGAGYGAGRGFRRYGGWMPGRYNPPYAPVAVENETAMLKADAQYLQRES